MAARKPLVMAAGVLREIPAVDNLTVADLAMTGTPTAPTAAPGTNTTQVATTAFVAGAMVLPTQVITANTTAVPGIHYLLAVGGITLTLPAALPAKDLCIAFSNVSGATTPAVDFNGHKLRGRTPGVMRLNFLDSRAMLQSTGNATYGWA